MNELAFRNLKLLSENNVKFYFTITGECNHWEMYIKEHYPEIAVLNIPIIQYEAIK